MAYKFMASKAILSGTLAAGVDDAFDLGASGAEWKDLYIDGTAYMDTVDIDGGNIDGTVIGATSVAAGSFAAVVGTTGTFSGVLKTDDATEATSTTDGSLQTDGGLSVAKSAVIGDDLDLLSDGAIMNIGSTSKFTLTALDANNAVMASTNHRLAFGDAGEYIAGDGTDLSIVSSGLVSITGDTNIVGTIAADTSLTLDTTTITTAEIAVLDGVTPGTAAASKALVLDASKDIATIGQLSAVGLTGSLRYSLDVANNGGIGMTPFDNSANVTDLKLSASYLTADAVAVGVDQFMFYDADGGVHRESFVDLATAMAGAGLTATNGVLSADASSTPNGIGNEDENLQEGFNYGTTTFTANHIWTTPDQSGGEVGDVVVVKAPENLDGNTLRVEGFLANTIDGMTHVLLDSDAAAITLTYVASGSWKIS